MGFTTSIACERSSTVNIPACAGVVPDVWIDDNEAVLVCHLPKTWSIMGTGIHVKGSARAVVEGDDERSAGGLAVEAVGNVIIHINVSRIAAVVGDLLEGCCAEGGWGCKGKDKEALGELHSDGSTGRW